jgi:hypothetical protein
LESTCVKSEHPDLPATIARLVRSATPVAPLDPPSVRLARWLVASAALALLSVVILGVRGDAAAQMVSGWFVARAAATLAVAVGAASVAFLMSVPGAEPSRVARALPVAACLVWAVMLISTIAWTRSPVDLPLRAAPHPSCALIIAATALLPGVVLSRMLRQAAPLAARWTGGLAGLASLAVGALGAQFVCANDSADHHVLWHLAPVVLLTLASIAASAALFKWPHHQERHSP